MQMQKMKDVAAYLICLRTLLVACVMMADCPCASPRKEYGIYIMADPNPESRMMRRRSCDRKFSFRQAVVKVKPDWRERERVDHRSQQITAVQNQKEIESWPWLAFTSNSYTEIRNPVLILRNKFLRNFRA